MNRLEKILLYLDGKMTEEELSEFREQLKIDPDLMAELDIHRLTEEVSKPDNEDRFRKKLESAYDEYQNKQADLPIRKLALFHSRVFLGLVSGAAAAILIWVVFLHPFMITQDEIFIKYYEPFRGDFSSRSTFSQQVIYPDKAIKSYLEGNYVSSFEELKIFSSNEISTSVVSNFYLGLSAIENEEYNLAIRSFEQVLKEDFSFLHEHAQWYLSLIYLKMEKFDLAKENLIDLKLQRSVYSKNSKKILQKIPK